MALVLHAKTELLSSVTGMEGDLQKLAASHANAQQALDDFSQAYKRFHAEFERLLRVVSGAGGSQVHLQTVRLMQEAGASFNQQYLMLMNKISHENRQFSMVSNIMKSKHDTAKSSINNIR